MQLLDASLAFVLTLAVLTTVVTIIMEACLRIAKMRKKIVEDVLSDTCRGASVIPNMSNTTGPQNGEVKVFRRKGKVPGRTQSPSRRKTFFNAINVWIGFHTPLKVL
nr:hypothetical protein [uncultured Desulfobacter sp.]